ncbi:hypothetical protein [Paracoccus sp. ME4]|uniref:hypothetical protein n=1 Tax=Paracoccus sp. ME4 TaxID=3138066 RepID=UPI00398B5F3F
MTEVITEAARHAEIREGVLALFMERTHDIRSPYALYDHPPMWNIFEEDGAVTAVRPAVVMDRLYGSYFETQGIGWGRHRDGEWIRDEQHYSGGWDHFIVKVLMPALARGARLIEPDRFPSLQGGGEVSYAEDPAP